MDSKNSNFSDYFKLENLIIATAIWSLLILRYGYFFGSGDHVELLPYSLFLNDHSLYPHDFFIQSLHASIPNERTIFANLLRPFTCCLPTTLFVLHYLNTVLLLLGLHKIANRFFTQSWESWIPIVVSILLLNDKALGNVDLYTPSLQAGDVACAIISWAIYFFLEKKYLRATWLMVTATFIHVLEGLDVMIVLGLILVIYRLQRRIPVKIVLKSILLYAITAVVFLSFLLLAKTNVDSTLSNKELFDVLFIFRHPHHFIFSTFPFINKILFCFLALFGLYWFEKNNKTLFLFYLLSLTLLVVYIIATDYFHFIMLANFQWYKLTQWIKVFSIISIFSWIFSLFNIKLKWPRYSLPILSIALIIVSFTMIFTNKSPFKSIYQIGTKAFQYSDINIAIRAKSNTPKDAVFVIPFSNSSFKYWSERSCYVEFKANVRNKAFVGEWYKRIGQVYGLDTTDKHVGFEKHWTADKVFEERINSNYVLNWKNWGVSYIVSTKETDNPLLTMIDKNADFYIYKINE